MTTWQEKEDIMARHYFSEPVEVLPINQFEAIFNLLPRDAIINDVSSDVILNSYVSWVHQNSTAITQNGTEDNLTSNKREKLADLFWCMYTRMYDTDSNRSLSISSTGDQTNHSLLDTFLQSVSEVNFYGEFDQIKNEFFDIKKQFSDLLTKIRYKHILNSYIIYYKRNGIRK